MTEFTMDDAVHTVIVVGALACCVFFWPGDTEKSQKNQTQIESTKPVQNNDTIKAIQINQQDTRQR